MFKQAIFDFLCKSFFKDQQGRTKELLRTEIVGTISKEREHQNNIEKSALVSQRCICFSNEWEDPLIGYVAHLDYFKSSTPFPVVFDLLTMQKRTVAGKTLLYTPARLSALLKLNPRERWMLTLPNFTNIQDIPDYQERPLKSSEEIINILKDNDFFACKNLKEYMFLHKDKYAQD